MYDHSVKDTHTMQDGDATTTTDDNLACQDANHCRQGGATESTAQVNCCQGVTHTSSNNNNNQQNINTESSQDPFNQPGLPPLQREMSIECVEPANSFQKPKSVSSTSDKLEEDEQDDYEHCSSDQEADATERVQQLFGLTSTERLIAEYPCYLLRLVTLPGWLYITNQGLCFYAALPGKKDDLRKTGYLFRKSHRKSPLSQRSYFQLKNNVLSWYNSAEDKYEPIDSIDLKQAIDVQDSTTRKFGFRVVGERRDWAFAADSDVSKKEWMDELRRAVFIARNSGNSVRIVLPFARIAKINRTFAFKFAEYIRVKLSHKNDMDNLDDEYYFSFFPDIDKAYRQIEKLWQAQTRTPGVRFEQNISEDNSAESSPFPSLDNVFSNASGMSAMIIGALTNPTSLWTSNGNNKAKHRNTDSSGAASTAQQENNEETSSSRRSTLSSGTDEPRNNEEPVSPAPYSTLALNSDDTVRQKQRNSWSFGWLSSAPTSPLPETPLQQVPQLTLPNVSTQQVIEPPSESKSGSTTTRNTNNVPPTLNPGQTEAAPKKKGRFRSKSTASIKQIARSTLGLTTSPIPTTTTTGSATATHPNKEPQQQNQQSQPQSPSSPKYSLQHSSTTSSSGETNHSVESSSSGGSGSSSSSGSSNGKLLLSPTKTRHIRSSSFGSGLKKHIRTPSNSDLHALLSSATSIQKLQHQATTTTQLQSAWIAPQLRNVLQQTSMPPKSSSLQDTATTDMDESQKRLAEHKLHETFPMLGDSEKVVAAFSSALWRTLPYYGRLYFTSNYVCFYSKVLAGRQKVAGYTHCRYYSSTTIQKSRLLPPS
ncbi:hypothetical protein BDB00DRAFT_126344 [Zychaea mexicana]|uniref:uncharacterized protein n=1 Tax=Zychaea mexicana TaxID=64656 RepID=UPI0022FF0D9C|nr:uncharacterized protein BDB00DRAFT_126344 [Zychaea mexicana]KAI9484650.1 hypothetical protein BDB00DRAFT_126344 [Zychaea mexicana]